MLAGACGARDSAQIARGLAIFQTQGIAKSCVVTEPSKRRAARRRSADGHSALSGALVRGEWSWLELDALSACLGVQPEPSGGSRGLPRSATVCRAPGGSSSSTRKSEDARVRRCESRSPCPKRSWGLS